MGEDCAIVDGMAEANDYAHAAARDMSLGRVGHALLATVVLDSYHSDEVVVSELDGTTVHDRHHTGLHEGTVW